VDLIVAKLLPETGRGTMRSMVEGAPGRAQRLRRAPTTMPLRAMVPLPLQGRIA